jgi:hypothetical protein
MLTFTQDDLKAAAERILKESWRRPRSRAVDTSVGMLTLLSRAFR